MIAVPAGVKVLIAAKPVDFRKGGDGLAALVREALGEDPFSGTIFIFRSKRAEGLAQAASGLADRAPDARRIWHEHSGDPDQPFQAIPITHSDRSRSVWRGVCEGAVGCIF